MAKTETPTQDFRNLDITGIVNGFVVSVETSRRTIHTRIEDLKEYVRKEGFEHDGIWYFRRSWMDEESARVFEKAGLSGLSKEGTNQLNRYTEQRLYSDDGLSIDSVKTLFVPESQMSAIRQMVHGTALEGVEIRPSEELEAIRMVKLLDEK